MRLDRDKKIIHLAWTIAIGFFASNLAYFSTYFFLPTLGADGIPVVPPIMLTLGEIQTAFYILGCVGLGIKLGEEKKTLPSIGFTMMSIAQGVIFVTYAVSTSSHESLEELYRIFMSSMYLLIPSMILIAFYSEFPRWLNVLGVLACMPLLAENILFSFTGEFTESLMILDGLGQFLICVTAFFWALHTLKNAKKEIRSHNEEIPSS